MESTAEEINIAPSNARGNNFAWPCKEGFAFTNFNIVGMPCNSPSWQFFDPKIVFGHGTSPAGVAGIGGYVYRGQSKALRGIYFFSDYIGAAQLYFLRYESGVSSEIGLFQPMLSDGAKVGFGESADGELFLLTQQRIYRLTDSPNFEDGFEGN